MIACGGRDQRPKAAGLLSSVEDAFDLNRRPLPATGSGGAVRIQRIRDCGECDRALLLLVMNPALESWDDDTTRAVRVHNR